MGRPSTYRPEGDGSIVATSAGVRDASQVGSFRLDSTETPEETTGYASVTDLLNGLAGKDYATGEGAVAQRYALDKGETVAFHAAVSSARAAAVGPDDPAGDEDPRPGGGPGRRRHAPRERPDRPAATLMRDAMRSTTTATRRRPVVRDVGARRWRRRHLPGLGLRWDAITAAQRRPGHALDHIRDFYDQNGPRYDQLHAGPMHTYAPGALYTRTGTGASSSRSTR